MRGGVTSVMAHQAALYARVTAVEATLLRMEHARRKHEDDAMLIHEELTRLQIRHTALHQHVSAPPRHPTAPTSETASRTSTALLDALEERMRTCEERVVGMAERLDAMVECVREVAKLRTVDLAAAAPQTVASHLHTAACSKPPTNIRVLTGAPLRRGVA